MQKKEKKQAAVFLDRDGTINEEVGYLDRPEKLRLLSGAARAIRCINESGMKAIVVTNQSGVARGFFDEAMVAAIHDKLQKMLAAQGARIDRFYYCPHHPTHGQGEYLKECPCRKPSPGMLFKAASELDLALADSYIVGDTLKDIEAGGRAGVRGALVRTGYGNESAGKIADFSAAASGMAVWQPSLVAVNLEEAVAWIMTERGEKH